MLTDINQNALRFSRINAVLNDVPNVTVIESDLYQIFHSSQIAGTGDNFCQFKDEAVDRAIERA